MIELFTQTDKKLIPTLPRYIFEGRIVVVQGEAEVNKAIRYLNTQSIVGIDTETRPSFRRGRQNSVALLQIASAELCFLFRLNFIGFPKELAAFLENPNILKVGLSLKDDIGQLRQRYSQFQPQGFVDLQQIAAKMGIYDMSLAKLVANFFRLRISKGAQLSNWEADVLDEKQKSYAATDAEVCLKLYHMMNELSVSKAYTLLPPPADAIPPSLCKNSSKSPKGKTASEQRKKKRKYFKSSTKGNHSSKPHNTPHH